MDLWLMLLIAAGAWIIIFDGLNGKKKKKKKD